MGNEEKQASVIFGSVLSGFTSSVVTYILGYIPIDDLLDFGNPLAEHKAVFAIVAGISMMIGYAIGYSIAKHSNTLSRNERRYILQQSEMSRKQRNAEILKSNETTFRAEESIECKAIAIAIYRYRKSAILSRHDSRIFLEKDGASFFNAETISEDSMKIMLEEWLVQTFDAVPDLVNSIEESEIKRVIKQYRVLFVNSDALTIISDK